MKKTSRFLALLIVPAMAISLAALLSACGGDEGTTETAKLVSSDPADGSEIAEGSQVTLTFDIDPGTVTANGEAAEGSGTIRRIKANAESIALAWDNGGSATLTFKLLPPDKEPPALSSSTPADGAKDVDPAGPNADGIVLEFSEPIAKQALQVSEGGTSLGWIGSIDGAKVTLKAPKGKELVNEKTYEVAGEVEDAAGNKTDVKVTFTTKAKQ